MLDLMYLLRFFKEKNRMAAVLNNVIEFGVFFALSVKCLVVVVIPFQ